MVVAIGVIGAMEIWIKWEERSITFTTTTYFSLHPIAKSMRKNFIFTDEVLDLLPFQGYFKAEKCNIFPFVNENDSTSLLNVK